MKKFTLIGITLLHGLLSFGQNSQQKEAEVRAMEIAEATALLQKDITTLEKIWSPGFMVNSPLNAIFIGGQVELVEAGIISYTSFTRTVEEVMVLKDVVITMGAETVVPTAPDPMAGQTVERRFTNIWIKEKGEWILVARHANNICSPVPTSQTQAQLIDKSVLSSHAIKVRWNPSSHAFFLDLPDEFTSKSQLQITDVNGRIVEKLEVKADTRTISIGRNYPAGIYFAQVINGHRKSTIKLVKM